MSQVTATINQGTHDLTPGQEIALVVDNSADTAGAWRARVVEVYDAKSARLEDLGPLVPGAVKHHIAVEAGEKANLPVYGGFITSRSRQRDGETMDKKYTAGETVSLRRQLVRESDSELHYHYYPHWDGLLSAEGEADILLTEEEAQALNDGAPFIRG